MIIRAPRPTSGWTSISNQTLRDQRLSYRARGVLAAILSRPDHWRTSADSLAREGKEGREAVRTAMRELQEAGYVVVDRVRDDKGQIRTVTYVYDVATGDRETGTQETGAGSLGPLVSNESNKPEVPPNSPPPGRTLEQVCADADDFDAFWLAYPRKAEKKAARRAWTKAVRDTDPATIIAGAQRYRDDPNREPAFTAHPSTWLNAGRWDDEPLPPREQSNRERSLRQGIALVDELSARETDGYWLTTHEPRALPGGSA